MVGIVEKLLWHRERRIMAAFALAAILLGFVAGRFVASILPDDVEAGSPATGATVPEVRARLGAEGRARAIYIDAGELARECGAGCSDYDIGMLWARREKVRDAETCMAYSWSYQRGCLAYLRQGRTIPGT